MDDDKTVHIAVIGDSGVGKTSLITAAASETFPDDPPPVLPPARLSADTTPEGVPVVITDTSSRPEDKQALALACQMADVIVLCFSMDKPNTLRRVSSYWMLELRRLGVNVPVMLVGCKSDIRPSDPSLHQAVLPIVKTFPQIETCMECSSKKLQFVGEVFYYALKAVVHPMAPLYEPEAQALKPLCSRALKRIFTLCDKDGDGVLSDAELNAFQVHCFSAPLQQEELVGVKQVVSEKIPSGIVNNGLSLAGFLFLHALFIERGRLETTWAVLRRFGYADDLRIASQVLDRPSIQRAADQVVELTDAGRKFFTDVFEKFDVDGDDVLSRREREEMFSTAPEDPWKTPDYEHVLVETSRKGAITLPGLLAMWTYTAAISPRAAVAGALYLGHPDDTSLDRLFQIRRVRRGDSSRKDGAAGPTLVQCAVFGGVEVDVTVVLDGLITQARPVHGPVPSGHLTAAVSTVSAPISSTSSASTPVGTSKEAGMEENAAASAPPVEAETATAAATAATTPTTSPRENDKVAVASQPPPTLLMRAIPSKDDLLDDVHRTDVAAFIFDATNPESFRSVVAEMVSVASAAGDTLPCVLISLNNDKASDDMTTEITETCAALELSLPIAFTTNPIGPVVYQRILAAAMHSESRGSIPETPTLKATRQYRRMVRRAALMAAGGTVTALAGYFAYKAYKASQDQQQSSSSGKSR